MKPSDSSSREVPVKNMIADAASSPLNRPAAATTAAVHGTVYVLSASRLPKQPPRWKMLLT